MREVTSLEMSDGQPAANNLKTGTRLGFQNIADAAAQIAGSKWAFIFALALVAVWAALGPVFGWSDTHQLIINTTTTIITFWVVFLLQNSANRASKALHAKIDELIRVTEAARNDLVGLEAKTEEEIGAAAESVKEAVVEENC